MTALELADVLRPSGDPRTTRAGVVVSRNTSAWTAVVMLDDETDVTVPALRNVDLSGVSAGDVALLIRDRHRLVMVGTYGAPQAPPATETRPPATDPPPAVATVTVAPTATGTARNSGWRPDTTDLYQGDWTGRGRNYGAAFYGTRISRLSGTCTRLRVTISRLDAGVYAAQAPRLVRYAQNGPTGAPTEQAAHTGPALTVGQTVTVDLPASWGTELLAGRAGGIGISAASPYVRLAGRVNWSSAFTLTITYRKG